MSYQFTKLSTDIANQAVLPSSTLLAPFDTALIDTRALSVNVKSLVTLDDYLRHRIRAIAGDNAAVMAVFHTAADYRFTTNVAKEIWPRYLDKEPKTGIASMTLSSLDKIVRQNTGDVGRPVQDVISVMMATMLEKQGVMSIELPITSIRVPKNIFPTFEMLKHESLVKATYDRIKAINVDSAFYTNVVGAMALKPFAEVFAKYSHIFRDIVLLGDKIDAYAAAIVIKLYDREAYMGALRGTLNVPALERAKTNYTLVSSVLEHFFGENGEHANVDSVMSVIARVGVTVVSDAIQEASLLLNESEYFKEVSIKSLPSMVSFYRFINNNGLPIGYIAQPNFKGKDEGLDVSEYYDSEFALNNLDVDTASENHLQPLVVAMYDRLRNISSSVAPLLTRVMLNDKGLSPDGATYQPVAIHIGLNSKMIEHLAVAFSNSISYGFRDGKVEKAFVFEKKAKDYQHILGALSPEIAYTTEAEAVILFGGQTGVQEATGFWELGSQTLPAKVRPTRYVGDSLFDKDSEGEEFMDVFVDREQKLTRTWKISVNVPDGMGGAKTHSITTSLYELYASSERAKFLRDERYVIAHNMPLLSYQINDVIDIYLHMSKLKKQDGYVQSPGEVARIQFANLVAPIVSNGTFRRLLQSIRFKLLAKAASSSLEERLALENYMMTTDIEARLSTQLLTTILTRLGLVEHSKATLLRTDIMETTEFYTVIRPLIVNAE